MKRLLPAITLLLILLVRAEARLGESKEQLEERYGKAATEENDGADKVMMFLKDPFKITCFLRNNSSVGVTYKKNEKWSEDEIIQILNKNKPEGVKWEKVDIGFDVTKVIYKTTDGSRDAIYTIFSSELTVMYHSEVQKASEEKQKKMDAL